MRINTVWKKTKPCMWIAQVTGKEYILTEDFLGANLTLTLIL